MGNALVSLAHHDDARLIVGILQTREGPPRSCREFVARGAAETQNMRVGFVPKA